MIVCVAIWILLNLLVHFFFRSVCRLFFQNSGRGVNRIPFIINHMIKSSIRQVFLKQPTMNMYNIPIEFDFFLKLLHLIWFCQWSFSTYKRPDEDSSPRRHYNYEVQLLFFIPTCNTCITWAIRWRIVYIWSLIMKIY